MTPPESNGPLTRTLAAWRVTPAADPLFRPSVGERIRRAGRETWGGYVRDHLVGWSVVAALAVAAAGITGRSVAQQRLESSREEMVISYLGNLDPRVLAKLPHSP